MDTRTPETPTAQRALSEAALCAWLGAAGPGDAIIYHRGALARQLFPQLGTLPIEQRVSVARLANRAWKLAEAGLAHLVQRRCGFEDYEYILVARRRPRRTAPAVLPFLIAEAA